MPLEVIGSVREALWLAVWLSLPVLGAVALAGLLAGGFSSLTRLGDAAGAVVVKQIAAGLALWAAGTWMGTQLWQFTSQLWSRLGSGGP